MPSISSIEIPIVPDLDVFWSAHERYGGLLYTRQELPNDVDPSHLFQAIQQNPFNYEPIGGGYDGVVRRVGGLAVKEFDKNSDMSKYRLKDGMVSGALPDLRSNVAMTEGLKLATQIPQPEIGFDINGVEIYAAYVPHDTDRPDAQILWLMEKLDPIKNVEFPIYDWKDINDKNTTYYPNFRQLRILYKSALLLAGVDIHHVNVDDVDANRITTLLPTAATRGVITKIDSIAERNKLTY